MRSDLFKNRLAAIAAVALLLVATTSCNNIGDDADDGEAVPLVTSITFAGLSVAAADDTTATITVFLEDRTGGNAGSFFNDVNFTDYSATFTTSTVPNKVGAFNTTFCQIGASCVLTIDLVSAADKALIPPASLPVNLFAEVVVEGRDTRGHAVEFTATVAFQITA